MIQSTEAFKRFANGQSWDQLDYQTQQQIRLMAILEQATAKYGTTLSQSVNGRISLFKSLLKDAALNVGNAFLPIVNAVMPILNSFAMVLKNVTAKLAEFIALMFNKKATVKDGGVAGAVNDMNGSLQDAAGGAGDLADAMGDADDASGGMADNLDDTAKSAKKAVKELLGLMGFDEINLLGKKDDSGDDDGAGKGKGGGGGGKGKKGKGGGGAPFKDILPEIALTDMDNQFKSIFDGLGNKLKGLSDLFSKGFTAAFRAEGLERIKIGLGQIKTTLEEIATDPRVVNAFNGMNKKIAYALGQITGSLATVGVGIGVFLAESIANGLGRQKERIIRSLVAEFENTGNMFASAGNIAQAFADGFYDVITSTGAIRIGSSVVSSILAIRSSIVEISYKFGGDLMKGIERIVTDNMPGIAEIFSNTLSDIAPIFESAEQAINDMVDSISRVYDNYYRPTIELVSKSISNIIGSFVKGWNEHIQPIIKKIGQGFSDTIGKHISPMIQKILDMASSFYEFFQVVVQYVSPIISFIVEQLTRVLAPTLEYIGEVFRVLFNTAADILGGIAGFLKGVFDIITGILTSDMSKIFEGFTETGDAIMNILSTIFTGLIDLTSAALKVLLDSIIALLQLIWDGTIAILKAILDSIIAYFKSLWDSIVAIFTPIGEWFAARWIDITVALANVAVWIGNMFQKAWNALTSIFASIGTWFGERWNDVTTALANVATWFGNIFLTAFEAVKNAFSTIGSFFSGVWTTVKNIFVNAGQMVGSAVGGAFKSAVNAVLGTIESVVNGFVGMINGVIGMINKIPGVSLGSIGYVSLPRLARGGIVDSPTVAMIGEAGKEVVMPLENTGFLQTMGRVVGGAVVNALGGGLTQSSGFSGSGDIVIQIGGHEFGRVAIQEINREQERAGQVLLNI